MADPSLDPVLPKSPSLPTSLSGEIEIVKEIIEIIAENSTLAAENKLLHKKIEMAEIKLMEHDIRSLPKPAFRPTEGFVYVMRISKEITKIGRAVSVENRLKQISNQWGDGVIVCFKLDCGIHFVEVEAASHNLARGSRASECGRDYYRMKTDDAIALVKKAHKDVSRIVRKITRERKMNISNKRIKSTLKAIDRSDLS